MNKPKYKIGERFISSQMGGVVIFSRYYSDREKDWIYALEYVDTDLMLFGCYSENGLGQLLGDFPIE